jgi:signal transduction histidine kinase
MSDLELFVEAFGAPSRSDGWVQDNLGRLAGLFEPLRAAWLGLFRENGSAFVEWGRRADDEPMPHSWHLAGDASLFSVSYSERGGFRFSGRFATEGSCHILKGSGEGLEAPPEQAFGAILPAIRVAVRLIVLAIGQHDEAASNEARVRQLRRERQVLEARQTELVGGILNEHEAHLSQERESAACLAEARDRAERASKVRELLLSNMSHELRTPLTAILGCAELLLHDEVDAEESRQLLATVHDRARDLLQLIQGVLDLSEMESGRVACHREPCSPAQVVLSAVQPFVPRAQSKGLEVSLVFETPMPGCASLDISRVQQVVQCLVDNAIKFTATGGIRIGAGFSQVESTGRLSVEVSDTGLGIPAEGLKEIFTPLHQNDSTLSRQFGGAGLGLALADRIVELMDGRIGVTSVPGKGSTFRIELPCEEWEEPGPVSDRYWPAIAGGPSGRDR